MGSSKPRFMRKLRKRQTQVESIGMSAESLAEKHFFKRLDRLVMVRRFVISWIMFFVLVCGVLVGQIRSLDVHFQKLQAVPGGIYTEGVLGDFTNANPLFASTAVDETVSELVFAGLLTYDNSNRLTGDLAQSYTADDAGKVYTVKLRPGLTWHDGQPLTSKDVVFTYKMIQNPDTQSFLNQGWKDITVAATDPLTVTFTLPNTLSSFPHHMTNGLIPEHLLRDVPPSELRSNVFNTLKPVGAGPFVWQKLEVTGENIDNRDQQIALRAFPEYHAGKPKLASFVVRAFRDPVRLQESFTAKEITGANFIEVPEAIKNDPTANVNSLMLTAANMVFFRQTKPVFADVAVRKALIQSTDIASITGALDYPTRPVKSPFLLKQLGYDPAILQAPYDPAAATAGLDAAGWVMDDRGVRVKAGQPLSFSLVAFDTEENRMVTSKLRENWKKLGVELTVKLQDSQTLQRSVAGDEYDALLYGISIGVDPDVFVYWHSSQDDPRSNGLNFSEYNSKAADEALEAGRTRVDASLRTVKYKSFLQAWQRDAPALGLYQPRYIYVTHGTVYGLDQKMINTAPDRLRSVHNWQVRQASVTNNPQSDLR